MREAAEVERECSFTRAPTVGEGHCPSPTVAYGIRMPNDYFRQKRKFPAQGAGKGYYFLAEAAYQLIFTAILGIRKIRREERAVSSISGIMYIPL